MDNQLTGFGRPKRPHGAPGVLYCELNSGSSRVSLAVAYLPWYHFNGMEWFTEMEWIGSFGMVFLGSIFFQPSFADGCIFSAFFHSVGFLYILLRTRYVVYLVY